ncbi:phage head closure protein [Fructobacillus sp. M158]|uniref:phage head closure protein n=1 Tax=Fructobacillus parabroussonetiae TaxID=2713174 RepID=UPI00200A758D|nr:phage head closure protein [Fructobacillus parabroussonetiae]MCK8617811.1 phage head closure protein [Fructobacillus parabroussonetiae]
MKFRPSDFNKIVRLGTIKSVPNENNGNLKKTFVETITLHYAPKNRTMTQQYTLLGTKLEDTLMIVIRHNTNVQDKMLAQLPDKKYYDIVGISPDESNNVIRYDILTLKLNQKGVK